MTCILFDLSSFLSSKLNFDLYFYLCQRDEIIQVGFNMHLYDDIRDASSSLRGSTSSLSFFVNVIPILFSWVTKYIFYLCLWRVHYPWRMSLMFTAVLPLATFGLRVSWYVNLQDRELLLDRSVPRSDVFYWLFVAVLVSLPRLLSCAVSPFSMGLSLLSYRPPCQSFLACSLLVHDLLPFSWEFVALVSARSFSNFFVLLLAALSFSVLSRLGRLFCCPTCLLLSARSPRRLLCRPTSASGAFMSAGLRPPFLGLLIPDRSLPWPPCACVASLAAFFAARRNGSLAALWGSFLAALWGSSLAARCTACLAARRAGSLAAQCTASLAARCTACLATRRPGSLAAQCAACFAAQCAACFAARCVACFAARCVACFAAPCAASLAARRAACFAARRAACFAAQCATCFAARCPACFATQCAACFAAQCDAYFTARGVTCLAAPCATSLDASRAAFLDAPYVGSFPARPVASFAAQAGPPSASVVSCLRLPFRGNLFLLLSQSGLSRWPPPYTGFPLL